ncbi:MAG: YraN family protein [Candidatus Falkowbacteria bacterium]|nr:YraN family protein [Candidatus Falkowbacteria bacterium]
MIKTKEIGQRGEAIAKEYLKKAGYRIIALNYRSWRLEIDIIAQQNERLIFLEIKTRFQNKADENETPLTGRQTKNLKHAIIEYCFKNRIRLDRTRLDLIVISVDRTTRLASLRHYPDIF